jgi:hypothetical protein
MFNLVLRLLTLELHDGWKIHAIHITGTLMIYQGTDGLSQRYKMTGVMGGAEMLTLIHSALATVERRPELMEWVDSWWGTGDTSWLTPKGWYAGIGSMSENPVEDFRRDYLSISILDIIFPTDFHFGHQ